MSNRLAAGTRPRALVWGGGTLLVFGLALLAIATLSWPFGWDQGIYAWAGDVIVRGGMPYRDAWEMKGPLVFYTFALAQTLFGQHLMAIRLLDLLFLAATAGALGAIIARTAGKTAAAGGALLFVLWYLSGTFWHTAQPDGWVGMLMVFGVTPILLARGRIPWWAWVVAGGAVGLITLYKQLYAIFLLVPLVALLLQREGGSRTHRAGAGALLLLAFIVPVAATVAWLSAVISLDLLLDTVMRYPAQVYVLIGAGGPGARLAGLARYLLGVPLLVILLPAIMLGARASWRQDRAQAAIILTWMGLALTGVLIQGRYFPYHWIPVIPPLVILATYGFSYALSFPGRATLRPAAYRFMSALLVITALYAAAHPALETVRWLAWQVGLTSSEQYNDGFGIPGPDIRAARYLAEHSGADDGVVIWGWNASILFMSGRQSPTRFGWSMPLMLGEGTAFRAAYRREFLCDISRDPPRWIVNAPQSERLLGGHFTVDDFPEFAALLNRHYRVRSTISDLVLYERDTTGVIDAGTACGGGGCVTVKSCRGVVHAKRPTPRTGHTGESINRCCLQGEAGNRS